MRNYNELAILPITLCAFLTKKQQWEVKNRKSKLEEAKKAQIVRTHNKFALILSLVHSTKYCGIY